MTQYLMMFCAWEQMAWQKCACNQSTVSKVRVSVPLKCNNILHLRAALKACPARVIFFFFDRSLMTYKIVNNLSPEILQNKFQERSSISKYNTRNKRDLHFQRPNLECVKKSFFYTGARAWNSIPQSIKDARSVVAFKKRLKLIF